MTLPSEFETYTRSLMGDDLYSAFIDGMSHEAPTSIRINPFKTSADSIKIRAEADRVPWCRYGYYLADRPAFTFDPMLHAGVYYVQEAASMFIDHVIRHAFGSDPISVLDLCAAPGGKSTCAMSALPAGSLLFSNEPIRPRAMVLAENIIKFGNSNMVVTNNYPADYKRAKMMFDAVIADVPCSGEGMFRKDGGAIAEWSLANVEKCRNLQRDIVTDIWHCLKPGGLMIYSTCTFNHHEDEENVEWIARELGADIIEIPTEKEWNITGALQSAIPVYRFIPGISRGEGLFMAVLRKHGDGGSADDKATLIKKASKQLKVLAHGIKPPTLKGKQAIPDHTEAMIIGNCKEQYPIVGVDYQQAIAYLRRESIVLDANSPRGIVMIGYKGATLGFAKNLGNRANNLYPQEWRIKSTHVPTDFEDVISL